MTSFPIETLRSVYAFYGNELFNDASWCEEVLHETFPAHPRQVELLARTAKEGMVTRILELPVQSALTAATGPLVQRIVKGLSITEKEACWVVECWARASGRIVEQTPESTNRASSDESTKSAPPPPQERTTLGSTVEPIQWACTIEAIDKEKKQRTRRWVVFGMGILLALLGVLYLVKSDVVVERLSHADKEDVTELTLRNSRSGRTVGPDKAEPARHSSPDALKWYVAESLPNANMLQGPINLSSMAKAKGKIFLAVVGDFPTSALANREESKWVLYYRRPDFALRLSDGSFVTADAFQFGSTGFWDADVSSERRRLSNTEHFAVSFTISRAEIVKGLSFQLKDLPPVSLIRDNYTAP